MISSSVFCPARAFPSGEGGIRRMSDEESIDRAVYLFIECKKDKASFFQDDFVFSLRLFARTAFFMEMI